MPLCLYFKAALTLCLVRLRGFWLGFYFPLLCSGSTRRRQFDHNGLMQATFLGLAGQKPGLCVCVCVCVHMLLFPSSFFFSSPPPPSEHHHHHSKAVSAVVVFCLFEEWLNIDCAGMNSDDLAPRSSPSIPRRLLKELKAFALGWISSEVKLL